MARLIDADALLGQNGLFEARGCRGNCNICELWSEEGCRVILNAPTVDAVEVVRCKECARYNTKGCADGFGWCEAWEQGRMDNDFCSYGSKTEGDSK